MKRKITNIVLSLGLLLGTVGALAPASYALSPVAVGHGGIVADSRSDVCAGAGLAGANCGDQGAGLTNVVKNVINILSIIIGITAVIMIILAGLKYVMSAGDTSAIASAKHTVLYAIVGLVIVAMSQVIVGFVLSKTK